MALSTYLLYTEPDVLQFPISLLTVAALTDSIQASLIRKYEHEAKWNAEMSRRRRSRSGLNFGMEAESQVRAKRGRRAEREAEGVVLDVQAVLMISDVSYTSSDQLGRPIYCHSV